MVIDLEKKLWWSIYFRLPSALDNRPLKIDEFHECQNQVIFTSATPSERELELCGGVIVEQIIRPTSFIRSKKYDEKLWPDRRLGIRDKINCQNNERILQLLH